MPTGADRAPLECDLVMKGGVTSGIIYPGAIAAVAATYRLRSIGGTSAGAIGAAAAAAMEFGRRSGREPAARERLEGLALELGERHGGAPLLQHLFEPDAATAPLFRLLQRLQAAASARGVAGALGVLALPALCWAAIALGLVAAALLWSEPSRGAVLAFALLLLVVVGVPALALLLAILSWWPVLRAGLRALAANGYGFCSGMAQARVDGETLPSLTEWLHARFQDLAGLPADEPLTFGDLWAASHRGVGATRDEALAAALRAAQDPRRPPATLATIARDIELVLVASDVNRAQSVQLPFLRREDLLYARRGDLLALFPPEIVAWMERHQRAPTDPRDDLAGVGLHGIDASEMLRLPRAEDLPVLVGVRMSLSFPFLFRAVRLYVLRERAGALGGGRELAELWITDGGITSNFPLHLFDAPIPTRPTFCLNLLYHDDELQPERVPAEGERPDAGLAPADAPPEEMVYMLRSNRGRLASYTRLAGGSPAAQLLRFAGRIVTTARQWGDNQLIDVPGYRDRIVHVRMRDGEGGFNVAMDSATIADLQRRGARAGEVIATRFVPDTLLDPLFAGEPLVLNWANHRFVRFRAFLAGLEVSASRFAAAWDDDRARAELPATDPLHQSPSIEHMAAEAGTAAEDRMPTKPGYPFANAAQRELALDMAAAIESLAALAPAPARDGVDRANDRPGASRPKQALRLRPSIDSDPRAELP
ncbi:patatin-like phospholipase family protein [Sphingomonas yunnanensis]|uniref:patatin-like phospholipase family protein n=1 Tax=Sphingomonas yunnanensis TaxID=310400 RepID=UPI001CA5F7DE|nr:patatin-like phospholipase family protein [Sphingomonas yunnanensis]MBY9064678.1 patatin-like phospholipase family protein [Sphingomonas yunnanensis]